MKNFISPSSFFGRNLVPAHFDKIFKRRNFGGHGCGKTLSLKRIVAHTLRESAQRESQTHNQLPITGRKVDVPIPRYTPRATLVGVGGARKSTSLRASVVASVHQVPAQSQQNMQAVEVSVQVESGSNDSENNMGGGSGGGGSGDDDSGGDDDDGGDGEQANPIKINVTIRLQSLDRNSPEYSDVSSTNQKDLRVTRAIPRKSNKLHERLVDIVCDLIAQIIAGIVVKLLGF